MKVNRLFAACVLTPTLISAIYYSLLASDVYISESRFVVRAPERQSTSALGLVLKGAGFSRSTDDAYAVQDYILSRDALRVLNQKLSIKDRFSSTKVDRISRFAGLDGDDSLEAFHEYYQKRVNIQLDSNSSIATLTVKAYSAEDALLINKSLIEMSEVLVNRLNERARHDLISFAKEEVAQAEVRAKKAALAISEFRNTKSVVDPEKQATLQLQQVAKLQEEIIANKAQLIQLKSMAKDNPQIAILNERIKYLKQAITEESSAVTGGTSSLTNKASAYQRLAIENDFAGKQLAAAMSSLEQAKNEAMKKQLYLERIAEPSRPDIATEPRKIRMITGIFLLCLIAWAAISVMTVAIKEHSDQ